MLLDSHFASLRANVSFAPQNGMNRRYAPRSQLKLLRDKLHIKWSAPYLHSSFATLTTFAFSKGCKRGFQRGRAESPAPLWGTQRKLIYGRAALKAAYPHEGWGCVSCPSLNDGSTIRIQGIRMLWNKASYKFVRRTGYHMSGRTAHVNNEGGEASRMAGGCAYTSATLLITYTHPPDSRAHIVRNF